MLEAKAKIFDYDKLKESVHTNKRDIDGQPEIAIWPLKPELLVSPKV